MSWPFVRTFLDLLLSFTVRLAISWWIFLLLCQDNISCFCLRPEHQYVHFFCLSASSSTLHASVFSYQKYFYSFVQVFVLTRQIVVLTVGGSSLCQTTFGCWVLDVQFGQRHFFTVFSGYSFGLNSTSFLETCFRLASLTNKSASRSSIRNWCFLFCVHHLSECSSWLRCNISIINQWWQNSNHVTWFRIFTSFIVIQTYNYHSTIKKVIKT